MPTAAVLPIKTFPRAKQRLRAAIDGPPREELAAAMVGDVLAALSATKGIDTLIVVTAEPRAARAARAAGATLVHDPNETGQSAAAARGIAAARAAGADRVLLVPGDCPALDPTEVEALLHPSLDAVVGPGATAADDAVPGPGATAADDAVVGPGATAADDAVSGPPDLVIVPDRHGTGTNALLLTPPDVIEPAFGPGSLGRHAARGRAAGARVRIAELPSLGHDVDTPADLEALRALLARGGHEAARTRAALA
jgi:2-phospho-L-lactate guanylyltransferase